MRVLVFAPHPDDEIIGVGGTIAKRTMNGDEVFVCVVTRGVEPLFRNDGVIEIQKQCKEADRLLGVKETVFLDFPAVMLETVPRYELNAQIFDVLQRFQPNEVYVPHRGDMQIDHKVVVDACMVALRPKYQHVINRIYSYETLSETGWDIPNVANEFIPTVYENISMTLELKLRAMQVFKSQVDEFPGARSIQAIQSLARFRGAIVNCCAAEAFSLIREIK